ncbi:WD40 repeat domain-containing protein [Streptomyces erythrochromogenes]|uniref:WD40 repeat domain-containing protein n=1 Tax=Streptomyces erythrochromogenes TaxID=285574 RepID=UPI0036876FEE
MGGCGGGVHRTGRHPPPRHRQRDQTVRIWNPATGLQDGKPLTGHDGAVRAVAVFTAPDGTPRLATGSEDRTVRIWNPATGLQDGKPLTGHTGCCR